MGGCLLALQCGDGRRSALWTAPLASHAYGPFRVYSDAVPSRQYSPQWKKARVISAHGMPNPAHPKSKVMVVASIECTAAPSYHHQGYDPALWSNIQLSCTLYSSRLTWTKERLLVIWQYWQAQGNHEMNCHRLGIWWLVAESSHQVTSQASNAPKRIA